MKRVWLSVVLACAAAALAITGLTLILTGSRPRFYDAVHHKWVTAPVTQNFPLSTGA